MVEDNVEAILISETHWDRAWYLPFEQFRLKLVKLVNKLLEILETDEEFTHFTFDGQTVVLEDYLEVVPEKRTHLQRLIQAGRILIGPWYVLPDEFLISGESMIRNLLMGRAMASEFGPVMNVGYVPDPFGHVSQVPQIFSQFGIDSVIFARGTGNEVDELGAEFIWEASDGSEVLAHWLPLSYGNVAGLPEDVDDAVSIIEQVMEDLKPHSRVDIMLLMNGSDHLEAQRHVPEVIKQYNSKRDGKIVMGTLPMFIEKLREKRDNLQKFKGEFRRSKHQNLLSGVYSARVFLKQANESAQNVLERWVEPWCTVSAVYGNSYPRDEIRQAWKYLLKNHPHDDICGCSIDEVHDDMMQRYRWIGEIAEPLVDEALEDLADLCSKTVPGVMVVNPTPYSRSGVAVVDILLSDLRYTRYGEVLLENPSLKPKTPLEAAKNEIHIASVRRWGLGMTPVAQREVEIGDERLTEFEFDFSAFALLFPAFGKFKRHVSTTYRVRVNSENQVVEVWGRKFDAEPLMSGHIVVRDEEGRVVASEVLDVEYRTNPRAHIVADPEEYLTLAIHTDSMEGLGFRRYDLDLVEDMVGAATLPELVRYSETLLENDMIQVSVEDYGTLTMTDKRSGEVYKGLLEFEDTEDVGDSYDYCPAERSITIRSAGVKYIRSSLESYSRPAENAREDTENERGEFTGLVGRLRIDGTLVLPESATFDSRGRSSELVECDFYHELTLFADSPVLHIKTGFENEAYDHRLRVLFPSNTGAKTSHADSMFDVIERPAAPEDGEDWKQPAASTCPLRSFVSVSSKERGLTIATKGLLEFELLDERGGTLALTLLRSVGWLSRITMKTRPEAAGPILEIPGAQCPGSHEFEYAIIPHSGNWLKSESYNETDKYLNRLIGTFVPKGDSDKLPQSRGFLSIKPTTIRLSAFKFSEDSERVVLRVWNIAERSESCTIKLGFPVSAVESANPDETPHNSQSLSLKNENEIEIEVPSRRIITLLLKPK
ncbi:MAG: alpha-mannosidase [Candidatus Thorarchaeota archaeon]|jgi:alpha-mannosidase